MDLFFIAIFKGIGIGLLAGTLGALFKFPQWLMMLFILALTLLTL